MWGCIMKRFTSLRRPMGGFMPPELAPEPVEKRAEGVAEALHRVEVLGRFMIRKIRHLEKQMAEQNVTTQQILDAVRAQRGQIASLSQLLGGIKIRLNEALKGEISPQGQATLNEIMSEIQGNARAINDAIATNDDDDTTIASDGKGGERWDAGVGTWSSGAPGTAAGDTSGTEGGTGGAAQNKPEQSMKMWTMTTLASSKAVVTQGEGISFSASVSGDGPGDKPISGSVLFATADREIGSAGVDSTGVAAILVHDLAPGDHEIVATYRGNEDYLSSTSNKVTQTVLPREDEKPKQDPEADKAKESEPQ